MNVRQLMQELIKIDPETEVLVNGYEMGYNKPTIIVSQVFQETSDKAGWKGDFELAEEIDEDEKKGDAFNAIVISRYNTEQEF